MPQGIAPCISFDGRYLTVERQIFGQVHLKRKIAAIIAADVVGYSTQIARDEEGTLKRLQACRSVFDEFVERYQGRIFNTAGDSILAEFSSAVEAVRCALEIQESLRTKNLALPKADQMQFRIGINLGDVVERQGDLLGDGVNIAARLEALSAPGGICISRSIHEQVQNKISITFADLGPQNVKNLPTPIHAYVVNSGEMPSVASASLRRKLQLAMLLAVGGLATIVAVTWWTQTRGTAVSAVPEKAPVASAAETRRSVEPAPLPSSRAPSQQIAQSGDPKPSSSPPADNNGKSVPFTSPATASVDYVVAMSCEKLPWTKGVLYQEAAMSVSGTMVQFARPIHWPDRNGPVIGTELGKGEINAAGDAYVDAAWGSSTNSYTVRYQGKITGTGGLLRGVQNWTREGRTHVRSCELVLRRK